MTAHRHSSIVTGVAVAFVVLWSSGFIAAKICLRYCPPITLLSARFLLASALMWGVARAFGATFPVTRGAWLRLALLGLLNLAIPMTLNFVALRRVSAGTAAIVTATIPLLLAAIAPRLLNERLTATRVAGLALGFGGVVVVMSARVGIARGSDSPFAVFLLFGNVLSLVSATIFLKRFPPRESLLVVNAVQLVVSGSLLLVPALAFERLSTRVLTPQFVGSFLYLLVALSIVASLLWFWLVSRGEASVASSYLFLSPMFGLLFATIFLDEAFTLRDGIGLAGTMTGIALIRR